MFILVFFIYLPGQNMVSGKLLKVCFEILLLIYQNKRSKQKKYKRPNKSNHSSIDLNSVDNGDETFSDDETNNNESPVHLTPLLPPACESKDVDMNTTNNCEQSSSAFNTNDFFRYNPINFDYGFWPSHFYDTNNNTNSYYQQQHASSIHTEENQNI